MFVLNDDYSIYITRGDAASFDLVAEDGDVSHLFQPGDVIRFSVCAKKDCTNVVLQKDFPVTTETDRVEIYLEEKDTKIGGLISKPVEYWYEVVLNPFTNPQTIIGYDDDGAKIFKLFPEGRELPTEEVDESDISPVDDRLDVTSKRPVQNMVIARKIAEMESEIEGLAFNGNLNGVRHDVQMNGHRLTGLGEGTEENHAVTLGQLARFAELVGEAVDLVVAIQSNILGTFPFMVADIPCQADSGMSWGEWLQSQYNKGGMVHCDPGGYITVYDEENYVFDQDGGVQQTDDIILPKSYIADASPHWEFEFMGTKYQFLPGSTWETWLNSEFNTSEPGYLYGNGDTLVSDFDEHGVFVDGNGTSVLDHSGLEVDVRDAIIPGEAYTTITEV